MVTSSASLNLLCWKDPMGRRTTGALSCIRFLGAELDDVRRAGVGVEGDARRDAEVEGGHFLGGDRALAEVVGACSAVLLRVDRPRRPCEPASFPASQGMVLGMSICS